EPAHPDRPTERGRIALAGGEDPRHAPAHPPGEHGVPVRDLVPVPVARGLRAADHGRDARRRHAVHPQRRGGGAVAHHRPDPRVVGEGRAAAGRVPGGLAGARGGQQDPPPGRPLAGDLVSRTAPEVPDAAATWYGQDVAPGDIEEALRHLLQEQYARDGAHAPARVLNLVVVIDREWRGEIMNRLEQVGRYHASRTILCTVEPRRQTIDASVLMTVDGGGAHDGVALMRERVVLEVGEKHLKNLDTIVDPLVVTDLQTLVW